MEGYRREAAQSAGQNGDDEQALPLCGHAAQQPGIETEVEGLQTHPIAGFRHFLAIH